MTDEETEGRATPRCPNFFPLGKGQEDMRTTNILAKEKWGNWGGLACWPEVDGNSDGHYFKESTKSSISDLNSES